MGAAVILLLTAGLTSYLLINAALGLALWVAALIVQVAIVVRWARGTNKARPGQHWK